MTSLTIALAALSLLSLLALILACTAISQARAMSRAMARMTDKPGADLEAETRSLRGDLEGLATQIHGMQQLPPQAALTPPPRSGLNLAKRSQALRLHRHGNPAAEIASLLEIPLQEVELLLKVHRIVISNIQN